MTAAQRKAVGRRMSAFWARKRAEKKAGQTPKSKDGAAISLEHKDELAKLGARVRLTELSAEMTRLHRFLKTG